MPSESRFRAWLSANRLLIDRTRYPSKAPFREYVALANRWCHKIVLTIAQVSVVAMLCIVFMNVALRNLARSGIPWAEEVPRLLVTYFALFACAIGVRDHMHISVSFVYNRFKKGGGARKLMDFLVDLSTLVCGIIIFYYGAATVQRLMARPGALPMTGWPTWIQYLAFPIGGFLMIFDSVLFLLRFVSPDDLLYSDKEVNYQDLVKEQAAAIAKNGKGG